MNAHMTTTAIADAAIAALPAKGPEAVQALIDSLDRICDSEHPCAGFATSPGLMQVMVLRLARERLALMLLPGVKLPQRPGAKTRDQIVASMCLTWDHSFGLMNHDQASGLMLSMGQVFDHEIAPLMPGVKLPCEIVGPAVVTECPTCNGTKKCSYRGREYTCGACATDPVSVAFRKVLDNKASVPS